MENKLRAQVAQLLSPMIGEDQFSSEIQIELNMDEVTSARESYDKDGAIRRETQQQSQRRGRPPRSASPACCRTPAGQCRSAARGSRGTTAGATPPQTVGESSATRTYELGREVAVSNTAPGGIRGCRSRSR
jgi:flagellar M-ring protein FliF